jgi:subtilase family serine protease
VGGTSAAAPTWAGIINAAESKSGVWAASTTAELTSFYTTDYTNATNYAHDFTDINYGYCNFYAGSSAGAGYDLCTGLGAPNGLGGK